MLNLVKVIGLDLNYLSKRFLIKVLINFFQLEDDGTRSNTIDPVSLSKGLGVNPHERSRLRNKFIFKKVLSEVSNELCSVRSLENKVITYDHVP